MTWGHEWKQATHGGHRIVQVRDYAVLHQDGVRGSKVIDRLGRYFF